MTGDFRIGEDPGLTMAVPRVFALADTHLSHERPDRDMTRFGEHWRGHPERIRSQTSETVAPDDILLLPGDLSWANKRRDAGADLAFLASLPGRKICVKGNHDHWWDTGKEIGYSGLETPPVRVGDLGIAGTRGWQTPRPGTVVFDRKMIGRERERLSRSLEAIDGAPRKLAMLHFPPHPFLDLLARHGVGDVVYGHIHLDPLPEDEPLAVFGERLQGVRCWCVAADRIGFRPVRIPWDQD
ncbi:MAG: metallophosphoesterase [Armatimonadota bacterium]